ncbi:unnamed protein product [Prorocentrum cordatum]|uniref:Uncharacterized protein n=1 Tax=Prorocentrum cordatum TaxID=2364126 RepID=A0ABN9V7X5_9DINO|nr:unnamed protein product [Polarella glacialis]
MSVHGAGSVRDAWGLLGWRGWLTQERLLSEVPARLVERRRDPPFCLGDRREGATAHEIHRAISPCLSEVLLEFAEGDLVADTRVTLAAELAGLIERGDPRLEHLAIVRAAVARGERAPRRPWPEDDSTCIVERAPHNVRGWSLMVSVHSTAGDSGLELKLAALDVGGSGDEFLLHLSCADLEALAPGATGLHPSEAAKAVMPCLRVVSRAGRRLLVAAQERRWRRRAWPTRSCRWSPSSAGSPRGTARRSGRSSTRSSS